MATAQLSFGIIFEEDFEFPWDDDKYDGDIENWWRKVNGYKNPNFNPYTKDGEYKPGVTENDPRISAWYDHQSEWLKANPLPVELVNYCSGDYPMWILAVPKIGEIASRGNPQAINSGSLSFEQEQLNSLLDFCERFKLEYESAASWYLTASD